MQAEARGSVELHAHLGATSATPSRITAAPYVKAIYIYIYICVDIDIDIDIHIL